MSNKHQKLVPQTSDHDRHASILNVESIKLVSKFKGKYDINTNITSDNDISNDDDLPPNNKPSLLKPKSFHASTPSIDVLGEASLAQKGKDFWENKMVCGYLIYCQNILLYLCVILIEL